MKKLYTYLILVFICFASTSFADDISDFKIEGIGIGDNIENFFSKSDINTNEVKYFTNDKYKTIAIRAPSNFKFETYKALQLTYNSKSKIISQVTGLLPINDMYECEKKIDLVTNDILDTVTILSKSDKNKKKLRQDSSGKSTMTAIGLYLKEGTIQIGCYDWSEEKGWTDNFRVSIHTNEFMDWSEKHLITRN